MVFLHTPTAIASLRSVYPCISAVEWKKALTGTLLYLAAKISTLILPPFLIFRFNPSYLILLEQRKGRLWNGRGPETALADLVLHGPPLCFISFNILFNSTFLINSKTCLNDGKHVNPLLGPLNHNACNTKNIDVLVEHVGTKMKN